MRSSAAADDRGVEGSLYNRRLFDLSSRPSGGTYFPSTSLLRALVGCRGATENSRDYNKALIKIQVVHYAVAAHAPPPRRRRALQALDIALERILLHGEEGSPNARLIFGRQLSKLFLRGAGELETPGHGGIGLTIQHPLCGTRRAPGAARRVPPWWAGRRDTGSQSRRGAPPGPTQIAYAILLSEPPQIGAPSLAAAKRSWSG